MNQEGTPQQAAAEPMLDAEESADDGRYLLKLYVTGTTEISSRAIVNIREICETYLKDRYVLEVVDISKDPSLAVGEQIIALPTLIKKLPLPLRRFIGDMSQTERLLLGLDLKQLK